MRPAGGLAAILGSLVLAGVIVGCVAVSQPADPSPLPPTSTDKPAATTPPDTPVSLAMDAYGPLSVESLPSATPQPTPFVSRTPTSTPEACQSEVCYFTQVFSLALPIQPPGRDKVDPTYRFGNTQNGAREPHHGVEFLNSAGTPVHAVADGQVVVAGDDRTQIYGLYPDFYGNLVILRHALPGLPWPVFTLYGHLSRVSVEVGAMVPAGAEIGRVGMTGVATGSHLHLEVRLGANSYQAARNPELWLKPHPGMNGLPGGALAGRVLDAGGRLLEVPSFVVERLMSQDGPVIETIYLDAYAEPELTGLAPWRESFGVGDLPAGWYRVSFVKSVVYRRVVQVLPGQLALLTVRLGEP